ncbi:MAG: hypothetical protein ACUVTC_06400 [Candidatus Bathycorpusculaceae bacterium]
MNSKNKNSKKIDISKMPKNERIRLLREVKEKLREKIIEAKLWQSLVEAETVTINGKTVFLEQESLKGLQLTSDAHFK